MIRDPSDGSVREPTKSAPEGLRSLNSGEIGPSVTLDCSGADTGLAPLEKDRAERLKRSREWLENYHHAYPVITLKR